MKKIFVSVMLALCASWAFAQPNYCMQETVVGTYAVAAQGTLIMPGPGGASLPVPSVSLGIAAIDSEGAISSLSYQSMGGQISQAPMPGTMRVNSDCTATVDWGQGVTGTLVIMDEGKEMNSLMKTFGSFGSAVVYGNWKRISRVPNTVVPAQCAPNAIRGTYAFRQSGTMIMTLPGSSQPAPVPMAMLGMGSANYDGSATATASASMGGQIVPFGITTAENIKVNQDCTATVLWNMTSQGAAMGQSQHFVVVLDGGNEMWGLGTKDSNGQPVTLATWTRVSTMPAAAK